MYCCDLLVDCVCCSVCMLYCLLCLVFFIGLLDIAFCLAIAWVVDCRGFAFLIGLVLGFDGVGLCW